VHAVVELRNGANVFQAFYCAAVVWVWGDGTIWENSAECDPSEAGKSEIRRRYSADHTFRTADGYRVTFRLKQRSRVVASANVNVQVRPGVRDGL
jgi:hypothetical protein